MITVLRTLNQHRAKLWLRLGVFLSALLWLAVRPDHWGETLRDPFAFLRWYHLLWALGMLEMAITLFPRIAPGATCGRVYESHYLPANHDPAGLAKHTRRVNKRLWGVLILWLLCITGLGVALRLRLIERAHIVFASVTCSLLDQLFVNIWCPMREWLMKNKCCSTCRIYSWGFAMMFSPLLFIFSFWTYSLIALSAAILVRWEIAYARHPERFSEMSNKALRCNRCAHPCRKVERIKHLPPPVEIPQEQTGTIG